MFCPCPVHLACFGPFGSQKNPIWGLEMVKRAFHGKDLRTFGWVKNAPIA